ncbi:MAG TPA: DsbA family protein, partial [Rhodoferax sp.]|nr:DsbA family protein [Rhodoferax sp.]
FEPYMAAVFHAIWVDAQNLNDAATVAAVLQAAEFDPLGLLTLTQDARVKEALKAATQEAIDRGVFGAPTFFVDGVMFWGQDRLDFVKEALQ